MSGGWPSGERDLVLHWAPELRQLGTWCLRLGEYSGDEELEDEVVEGEEEEEEQHGLAKEGRAGTWTSRRPPWLERLPR